MVFSGFQASHFVLFWRGASSESQRSSRRPIRERELPVRARGQQAMQQVPGVSARFWREEGGGGFWGRGAWGCVRGGAGMGGRGA
jgi:outer membrane receptor for Fe3+-dicitrate